MASANLAVSFFAEDLREFDLQHHLRIVHHPHNRRLIATVERPDWQLLGCCESWEELPLLL